MLKIEVATLNDISSIVAIGKEIWEEHYTPIIGSDQVSYMLGKFQSESAIEKQITDGYDYFKVLDQEELIGYLATEKRPNADEKIVFISKFYIRNDQRGKGYGSRCLKFLLNHYSNEDAFQLLVNKYNYDSIKAYKAWGFKSVDSVKIDIGGGFFMDDYVMKLYID